MGRVQAKGDWLRDSGRRCWSGRCSVGRSLAVIHTPVRYVLARMEGPYSMEERRTKCCPGTVFERFHAEEEVWLTQLWRLKVPNSKMRACRSRQ